MLFSSLTSWTNPSPNPSTHRKDKPYLALYRVPQHSKLHQLPLEILLLIIYHLPRHGQEALRQSCASFFYAFHPPGQNLIPDVRKRLIAPGDDSHSTSSFREFWRRDLYRLRVETPEREQRWHFFRKACCGHCLEQHPRRFFSWVELAKDPAERVCIGCEGTLQISPAISIRFPEFANLPFCLSQQLRGLKGVYKFHDWDVSCSPENNQSSSRSSPSEVCFKIDPRITTALEDSLRLDRYCTHLRSTFELPPTLERTSQGYVIAYRRSILKRHRDECTTRIALQEALTRLREDLYICPHVPVDSLLLVEMWDDVDQRHMQRDLPGTSGITEKPIPQMLELDCSPGIMKGPWAGHASCPVRYCDTHFWLGRVSYPANHRESFEDDVYLAVERRLGLKPTDRAWLAQLV